MSHRYYLATELSVGARPSLDGTEAHHLLNVMRAKPGHAIEIFDGNGQQADAVVVSSTRKEVQVEILNVQTANRLPQRRIVIAAAAPKGDRLRFLLEKLTELGAVAWLPLETQHSVNALNPSTLRKANQWVIDACKQSQRNHLLDILPPVPLEELLGKPPLATTGWIATAPRDQLAERSVETFANNDASAAYDHIVLVGPEGGFSEAEQNAAQDAGYQPWHLGQLVLRIETAAVAALVAAVQAEATPA